MDEIEAREKIEEKREMAVSHCHPLQFGCWVQAGWVNW
jgi:hypothetical protein